MGRYIIIYIVEKTLKTLKKSIDIYNQMTIIVYIRYIKPHMKRRY